MRHKTKKQKYSMKGCSNLGGGSALKGAYNQNPYIPYRGPSGLYPGWLNSGFNQHKGMKRKTRQVRRKKSRRRTQRRRHGGMKSVANAAKCCAKHILQASVDIGKSTAQDEFRQRGPLHQIENRSKLANQSPKSLDFSMLTNENRNSNSPFYLQKDMYKNF